MFGKSCQTIMAMPSQMTGAPSRWSPPGPGGRQVDRRSVEVHAAGRAKEVNIAIAEGAAISSDQTSR